MMILMPYVAYERETGIYLNTDKTIGFAWKCQLRVSSGDETDEARKLLPFFDLPEGSVLQFMLYADPEYLLVVSVKLVVDEKIEISEALDIRERVFNALKNLELHPKPQTPQDFINFMSKIFTGAKTKHAYNDEKPIKKQCIPSNTKMELNWNELKFNQRILNCLIPRRVPEDIEKNTVKELIKNFFNFPNTPGRLNTSFLYAINIVFENKSPGPETEISKKIQKFAPGLNPQIPARNENKLYLNALPIFWIISKFAPEAINNLAKAKLLFGLSGITAHEEKELLTPLFIASLPFGVYNQQNSFKSIDRGFVLNREVALEFLPLHIKNSQLFIQEKKYADAIKNSDSV